MKHLNLTDELYEYMLDVSLHEDPILAELRKKTSTMSLAKMQVAPEQAQFMQFLLKLINAQTVLELGTFTGYSTLSMALALPDNGRVITCDVNDDWTKIALNYWRKAQQEHKIELRLNPALSTLADLLQEGYARSFDFIFIDADKTNYLNYYELALKLITRKGIIAIDNVLWYGQVINKEDNRAQTREIRRLNDYLKVDKRVNISLLPIADGLFLIRLINSNQ